MNFTTEELEEIKQQAESLGGSALSKLIAVYMQLKRDYDETNVNLSAVQNHSKNQLEQYRQIKIACKTLTDVLIGFNLSNNDKIKECMVELDKALKYKGSS